VPQGMGFSCFFFRVGCCTQVQKASTRIDTHTHTHTPTQPHTHTHTRNYTQTQTQTQTHTYTPTPTHPHTRTYSHLLRSGGLVVAHTSKRRGEAQTNCHSRTPGALLIPGLPKGRSAINMYVCIACVCVCVCVCEKRMDLEEQWRIILKSQYTVAIYKINILGQYKETL
jgi:hypothetical protein